MRGHRTRAALAVGGERPTATATGITKRVIFRNQLLTVANNEALSKRRKKERGKRGIWGVYVLQFGKHEVGARWVTHVCLPGSGFINALLPPVAKSGTSCPPGADDQMIVPFYDRTHVLVKRLIPPNRKPGFFLKTGVLVY